MGWKGLIAAVLGGGYLVTCMIGIPETRHGFARGLMEPRLEAFGDESPIFAKLTPDEREALIEHAEVEIDWTVPVLPGVILVVYSQNSMGCASGGLVRTAWSPGYVRVLHAI